MNKEWTIFTICLLSIVLMYILHRLYTYRENLLQDDPMLHTLKRKLAPIDEHIKDVRLYKGNKSYTINKKKIYLCLKDKNDEYYSVNMLTYVFLHEFAHVKCDELGHTEKFNTIFYQQKIQVLKDGEESPL